MASTQPNQVSAPSPRRLHTFVDRLGATASLACAVHCIALPFVLALLPLVGLGFLAGHTFEQVFVLCAALLATSSIVVGYRRHGHPQGLLLMVPGIALLVFGVAVALDTNVVLHTVSVVIGGVLVASAHLTNLVLTHRHCDHGTHRGGGCDASTPDRPSACIASGASGA